MREGWDLKTLADLFDIGSSKRVYESQWRNAGVPFYRAREIVKLSRDGYVDNELFIDEELYEEYANKYGIPKCGDLMVTGVGTLGVCYIVRDNDKFYFKDGNILWFKSKKGTNPFYVRYAFKSNYLRQQIENCNGATVGTFTIVRAKKTTIPVPPIAEQERIVAELDLLSAIIEKKKEQLKAYDQLAQSIFYTMFGDPIDNPKGWEVKTIGNTCTITCGQDYKTVEDENGKYPIYGTGGIMGWANQFRCPKDSVIIGRKGNINNPILVDVDFWNVDTAFGVTPKNEVLSAIYFFFFCKEYDFTQHDVSVTIPSLRRTDILKIKLPVPPLSLQQAFAEKIEAIERQKALVQQSIEETQTMFDCTMDKYFG